MTKNAPSAAGGIHFEQQQNHHNLELPSGISRGGIGIYGLTHHTSNLPSWRTTLSPHTTISTTPTNHVTSTSTSGSTNQQQNPSSSGSPSFPNSHLSLPSREILGVSIATTPVEFSILSYLTDLQVRSIDSHKFTFCFIQDPSDVIRQRGARNIRVYVEVFSRGVSPEAFAQVMDALCDRLYASLGSNNPYVVLGVIITIDTLVSVQVASDDLEDTCRNCCIRFISFLRILFQTKSVFEVPTRDNNETQIKEEDFWKLLLIGRSAAALGHVAREGLRLRMNGNGLIDYDLKRAFEWLTEKPRKGTDSDNGFAPRTAQLLAYSSRRLASVLLLKEIAYSVPMIMQTHLPRFFNHIWVAIQEDEIDTIRAAGVEALGAVLQLLLQRDPANKRVTYYTLIWKHIKKRLPPTALVKLDNGLSYTTTQLSTWQGSLLVLGELLDRNNGSNRFMLPRFTVVSGVVLSFTKAGFTTPIYEAVVRLASRLAQLDPRGFVENGYLEKFVTFLIGCLETTEASSSDSSSTEAHISLKKICIGNRRVDPDLVLSSLGDIAMAVEHYIASHTEVLLAHLLKFLSEPLRKRVESPLPWLTDDLDRLFRQQIPQLSIQRSIAGSFLKNECYRSALESTIKLVKAAGVTMINHLHSLIDKMFMGGLSEGLFLALRQITEALPPALPIVQSRTLVGLAELLSTTTFSPTTENEEVIRLALAALGNVGVEDPVENPFVVDCILRFLEKGSSSVLRRQAALTVIQMVLPQSKALSKRVDDDAEISQPLKEGASGCEEFMFFFPTTALREEHPSKRKQHPLAWSYKLTRTQMRHIQLAVERVVFFAVSEAEPTTRSVVLDALTSKFDPFLSSPSCAAALAQALHDEDLQARRSALRLLARLASRHEGTMLQALNQVLVELLATLEFEVCLFSKGKAAQELGDLVDHGTPLLVPYAETVLTVILKQLKQVQTDLVPYRDGTTTPPSSAARRSPIRSRSREEGGLFFIPFSNVQQAWDASTASATPSVSTTAAPSDSSTVAKVTVPRGQSQPSELENVNPKDASPGDVESRLFVVSDFVRNLLRAVTSLLDHMLKNQLSGYIDGLVEVLLELLAMDSTGTIWLAEVLNSLSSLWRNACHPVQPYTEMPFLLPYLLNIIQSRTHPNDTRRAVLRLLGVLGALDPHQYHTLVAQSKSSSRTITRIPCAKTLLQMRLPGGDLRTSSDNSTELDCVGLLSDGRLEQPIRFYCMQQIVKNRKLSKSQNTIWQQQQKPAIRTIDDNESIDGSGWSSCSDLSDGSQYCGSDSDDDDDIKEQPNIFVRHAVVAVLRLLSDPSQTCQSRSIATQTLLAVLQGLGSKYNIFASIALPALLNLVASSSDSAERSRLLIYIGRLISVCREHFRPFLTQFVSTLASILDNLIVTQRLTATTRTPTSVARNTSSNTTELTTTSQKYSARFGLLSNRPILPNQRSYFNDTFEPTTDAYQSEASLVSEAMAVLSVIGVIWKHPIKGVVGFGHRLIPKLFMLLRQDFSRERHLTLAILSCLAQDRFGIVLNDLLYLVLPPLLHLFESRQTPIRTKLATLTFIRRLVLSCDLSLILSPIIHPLHRALRDVRLSLEIKLSVISTLKVLNDAYSLDLQPFINLIRCAIFDQHLAAPSPFQSLDHLLSKLHDQPQQEHLSQQPNLTDLTIGSPTPISTKQSASVEILQPSCQSRIQSASNTTRSKSLSRTQEGITSVAIRPKHNSLQGCYSTSSSRLFWNRSSDILDGYSPPHRPHSKSTGDVGFSAFSRDRTLSNQSAGNSTTSTVAAGKSSHGIGKVAFLWVDEEALRQVWSSSACTSPEEWSNWLRRLTAEMTRGSSAPCIRECAVLVQCGVGFAREIFPAAFLSCWIYLSDKGRLELAENIGRAISSVQMTLSDLQQILNLAEVMRMQDEALPIDTEILVRVADRCHAFAKALVYRELEWQTEPETCVEPLIALYDSLQQKDAAVGVLNYAQQYLGIGRNKLWTEKLQQWNVALQAYEIQQLDEPDSVDWLKGRLRCLYALGHWDRVSMTAEAVWDVNDSLLRDPRHRTDVARIATAAELNLQNYSRMAKYAKQLDYQVRCNFRGPNSVDVFTSFDDEEKQDDEMDKDGGSFESAFFGSILKINDGEFAEAQKLIERGRDVLEVELTALLAESYTRAYRTLVKLQQLAELEEAIAFKQNEVTGAKRAEIRELWAKRLLEGCQPDTDVWHSMLQVRAICIPPRDDVSIWLKFASLSRKQERFGIALRVIQDIRSDERASQDPRVFVASTKNIYAAGQKQEALRLLQSFCQTISSVSGLEVDHSAALVKPSALHELFRVVQHFPVQDLLNLQRQIRRSVERHNDSCHRFMPSSLVQSLASAGLFCPPLEIEAKQHFACLGLSPADVNLLLGTCHLKLSKWSQSIHDGSSALIVHPPCRLVPDASENQIASGELLGGWCSIPGLLVDVCSNLRTAIKCCPEAHKVWRDWAELNFQLVQITDQSRGYHRSTTTTRKKDSGPTTSSQQAASVAALSLEVCPVLAQLKDEQRSIYDAWKSTYCRCPCHEGGLMATPISCSPPRRLGGRTSQRFSPSVARLRGTDQILKALERFRRSLSLQVQQHCRFVVDAAGGFVRSIALRPSSGQDIQELLRLLTVWFRHSELSELNDILREGIATLPTQTWIPVIPQILARLKTHNDDLMSMLSLLLGCVSESYPEALVFPMMAAVNGSERTTTDEDAYQSHRALELLESISLRHPVLAAESKLVSEELIRISILNPEKWHETLKESSRLFYTEKNIPLMIQTLLMIYDESQETGAHTFRDLTFSQNYVRDLGLANVYLRRFIAANTEYKNYLENPITYSTTEIQSIPWKHLHDLDQAWQIYYIVFSQLFQQISKTSRVDLQFVSPKLKAISNLQIAIPGRYSPLSQYPRIQAFDTRVDIFSSKQRPRKICMIGSDGHEYAFLVKGHEDLRQDERVIQVLMLVNRFLMGESFRAHRSRLRLQRTNTSYGSLDIEGSQDIDQQYFNSGSSDVTIPVYSVVPLSTNCGIIEWVSGCDTLHSLIKRYRKIYDISLSLEHDLMKKPYAKYEELPLLQKMEVFQSTLENTSGEDLREILWKSSRNSETWFERRSNFTSSLALMSMTGYVLGLGDRHPSNLMIMRTSGKIIHIDFGDCFEVTALRDCFPEKIPFRLTRMFLNAMEVGGLEGRFRITCERVIRSLRSNKDAVVATLETFVYDPLITWRVLEKQHRKLEIILKASSGLLHSLTMMTQHPQLQDANSKVMKDNQQQMKLHYSEVIAKATIHCNRCHNQQIELPISRRCATSSNASLRNTRRKDYLLIKESKQGINELTDKERRRSMKSYSYDSLSKQVLGIRYQLDTDESGYESETESTIKDEQNNDDWETNSESMQWRSKEYLMASRFRRRFQTVSENCLNGLQQPVTPKRHRVRGREPPMSTRSVSSKRLKRLSSSSVQLSNAKRLSETNTSQRSSLLPSAGRDPALLSEVAEMVLQRIETKLNGTDFGSRGRLDVSAQVERLIQEATSLQNLSQCFVGWCPFW